MGGIYNMVIVLYMKIQSNLYGDIQPFRTDIEVTILYEYKLKCGTQVSGYLAKELSSALQTEVLGENGSDCGTTKGLSVTIPAGKPDDYLYRYIIENDKLIWLTPDIISKYIGKEVKMRSPMFCIAKDCICSKCAGEDFYKLGKKAIGLTATKVATTCSRLNMKKFHENLVKTRDIDLKDIFL